MRSIGVRARRGARRSARVAFAVLFGPSLAQAQTGGQRLPNAGPNCLPAGAKPTVPLKGTLERVAVHGASLVGNLEHDSADRCVSVYLPPSYATDRNRRYPVVYILHGYTDDDQHWFGWTRHFVNVPAGLEKDLAAGTAKEMILVMANAFTVWHGSMYSSSVTTGDWERFVADDLVSYVDSHYRTIAKRESRGLSGHSMGGYGAIRIGMKRPDVFSSDYVMSPCCMPASLTFDSARTAVVEAVTDTSQAAKVPFGNRAMLASAAAWSPDPQKPPLYFDLPTQNGKMQPHVIAAWAANAPLSMVYQYISNLKRYGALAIDAGAQDAAIAAASRQLDSILTRFGVSHEFEIYDPGTHTSRVEERIETSVMPFFTKHLLFQ